MSCRTNNMHALIDGHLCRRRHGVGGTRWSARLAAATGGDEELVVDAGRGDRQQFARPARISIRRAGRVPVGTPVQIASDDGTVYFTTDGSDPRLPGGEVSPRAMVADSQQPLVIDADTQVIARTFRSNRWSAPVNALYQILAPTTSTATDS